MTIMQITASGAIGQDPYGVVCKRLCMQHPLLVAHAARCRVRVCTLLAGVSDPGKDPAAPLLTPALLPPAWRPQCATPLGESFVTLQSPSVGNQGGAGKGQRACKPPSSLHTLYVATGALPVGVVGFAESNYGGCCERGCQLHAFRVTALHIFGCTRAVCPATCA